MTEEKTQNEQKNTVGTAGMRFSIIWLIALITVFFIRLWLPLLLVWFILWIIGLFYKPRGKARIAVSIPLVVFIALASVVCYVWSSIKTPTTQFTDWIKVEFENIDDENFDNDRFNAITNEEFNNIRASITEEEFKTLLENSTWSNTLEKWAYVLFGLLQQGFENSLERYNNELPEISEDDSLMDDEDESDEDDEFTDQEDVIVESDTDENNEDFSVDEKNDIEEIIDILE